MRKKNRKTFIFACKLTIFSLFIIGFFAIISETFKVNKNITYDVGKNRAVKAIHLVSKYIPEKTEIKTVNTFSALLKYAPTNPIKFTGTMTGYGPDCAGCSGYLGCPPRHNAKNGNIYFKDNEYGKIRIVASDQRIPCGTIIKVDNLRQYDSFYAIVLDRGGAIKETLFDLLFKSEKEASSLGRAKASYTIVRWGW